MYDSHCHLDRLGADIEDTLKRAHTAGVTNFLIAGVGPTTWTTQLDLIRPGVVIAIGVHPWTIASTPLHLQRLLNQLSSFVEQHAMHISAIGETGLDFGKRIDPNTHNAQRRAFRAHIEIAAHCELPLVIHAVHAHAAILEILNDARLPEARGVIHSFSGSADIAAQYTRLGFSISFSGAVTDPKRRKLHNAAASIPDEFLLVETDSPDQTPFDRKPAPNEPAFLIDVIAKVAKIRDQTPEEVAQTTTLNAMALFSR